ncbi:MAG: DNA translocase FtsK, partial [Spirochaetaceae bacterium]|nr:DNA translocase FtsK [Spirochaetaceae bacterium]
MTLKTFFSRPDYKFRLAAMAGALGLGGFSLFLGFSIAVSFFNLPGIPALPVDFLTDAYGFLSFGIPLYLFGAAALLADPQYRPNRIFILNAGIFPFFTLAVGFAFIRDFMDYSDRIPFLASLGKTGFCFLVITLTFIEGLVIMALVSFLFPSPAPKQTPKAGAGRAGPRTLLPPPKATINDIYIEAAFLKDGGGKIQSSPPAADAKALEFSGGALSGMEGRHVVREEVQKFDAYIEEPDFLEDIRFLEPVEEVFSDEPEYADEPEYEGDEAPEEISPHGKGAWAEEIDQDETLTWKRESKIGKLKKHLPYQIPVEGILNQYPDGQYWIIDQGTRDAAITLKETLEEFKIQAEVTGIRKGPVITMFEILPAPGVKLSRIVNLQDNIALRLAA